VLREPGLDSVRREVLSNVRECAAAITGVDADALTQQFLDFWDEGELCWYLQTVERVVSRLKTAGQRASVIALRGLNVLRLD
jgi:hypothetical protein